MYSGNPHYLEIDPPADLGYVEIDDYIRRWALGVAAGGWRLFPVSSIVIYTTTAAMDTFPDCGYTSFFGGWDDYRFTRGQATTGNVAGGTSPDDTLIITDRGLAGTCTASSLPLGWAARVRRG